MLAPTGTKREILENLGSGGVLPSSLIGTVGNYRVTGVSSIYDTLSNVISDNFDVDGLNEVILREPYLKETDLGFEERGLEYLITSLTRPIR